MNSCTELAWKLFHVQVTLDVWLKNEVVNVITRKLSIEVSTKSII